MPYETPQMKITLAHGNESSARSKALLLLFQQAQPSSLITDRKGEMLLVPDLPPPLRARGAIRWAPLLPKGNMLLPLPPRQRSGETLGPKPQQAMGTVEGLRGGQGGQDSHQRLCNRGSGQKFPSASVPKVKLPSEGHTIFMNLYQHVASKKTTGSISGSLGWLPQGGNANGC